MGCKKLLSQFFATPEFRIACSGCWVFFLSVGVVRGLTVVQDALIIYFEADATKIMSFSAALLAAYAIGGLASGYIIPKYGVRGPTIFAGISCCLGVCLCGILLKVKSIILMVLILFVFVGLPQGVAINAVLGSAKSNVRSKYMGLVMTLVGGGISVASLILPLVFTEFCAHVGNCHAVPRVGGMYQEVEGLDKLFYFIGGLMFIMVPSGMILMEKDALFTQQPEVTDESSTSSSSSGSDEEQLIPRKSSKSEEDQIEDASFWSWELLSLPHFSIHLLGQFIFFSAYFAMFPLAFDMLDSIGFERRTEIPLLLLILGIVELCSRIFYAFVLADRYDKIKLMGLTYLGDGLGFLILLAAYYSNLTPDIDRDGDFGSGMISNDTYEELEIREFRMKWGFTLLAFIIGGFFNAGFGGLINAALVEIVHPRSYATAVGMQALAIGLGETVGPFIGGVVADKSVPVERLEKCNMMDKWNGTDFKHLQNEVLNSDISSPMRLSDKEYQLYLVNGEIDWDIYCEKQYWRCFVVGSSGMILSAVCVGIMKWTWEREKRRQENIQNKVST